MVCVLVCEYRADSGLVTARGTRRRRLAGCQGSSPSKDGMSSIKPRSRFAKTRQHTLTNAFVSREAGFLNRGRDARNIACAILIFPSFLIGDSMQHSDKFLKIV